MADELSFGEEGQRPLLSLKDRQRNQEDTSRFEQLALHSGVALSIEQKIPEEETVSGDFFRVEQLDDDTLDFFIGDVQGHGEEAAKVSLSLHEFMNENYLKSLKDLHPSEALKLLDTNHNILQAITTYNRYLTFAHVRINSKTGDFEYANAGVPYMMIVKPDGQIETLNSSGFYIGKGGYNRINSGTLSGRLAPNEMGILMTDGISESRDKNGTLMSKVFESGNLKEVR